MALQNLHEMIRNLSSYIKSLEVLCESGVRLSKNFERLLSPGPGVLGACSTSSATLEGDVLNQSVATWELAHKVTTADANALITELLPLLQETVQNVMKDPATFHSTNTYEVFRSCFASCFQIQWRFCSIYLQCTSSEGAYRASHGSYARSPDAHLARSPTSASFSSSSLSGDRRESTESCMSSFSLPRSSISGLSALSSRSSSPSPQTHSHTTHPYGHHSRSRNSSNPSVKFTPSQPPSPLMPYGEGHYPHLFRRWSAHTHNYSNSSISSGPSTSSNLTGAGSYGSSSGGNGGFTTIGFSRRWSVPASCGNQGGSTSDSTRKSDHCDVYDYALLDAINLLSSKPSAPTALKHLPLDEDGNEYGDGETEQTTSLWPPSETMPGVVLTTCGSDTESVLTLEGLQRSSHQSLRVPFSASVETTPTPSHPVTVSIMASPVQSQPHTGEYSLFGNSPNPTQGPPQQQQQQQLYNP